MIFRLGYEPQTLELGGVKVENFGKAIAMGGLPTSMTTDRRRAKALAAAARTRRRRTAPTEAGDLTFEVDAAKVIRPISPYVYGINSQKEEGTNVTVRRMGGNRQTGYNWETNASNAGNDYDHQSDEWPCISMLATRTAACRARSSSTSRARTRRWAPRRWRRSRSSTTSPPTRTRRSARRTRRPARAG